MRTHADVALIGGRAAPLPSTGGCVAAGPCVCVPMGTSGSRDRGGGGGGVGA